MNAAQRQTKINFLATAFLLTFATLQFNEYNIEDESAFQHTLDKCVYVAGHELHMHGRWDDESGACFVRMRFRGLGNATVIQDVPLNQVPPSL